MQAIRLLCKNASNKTTKSDQIGPNKPAHAYDIYRQTLEQPQRYKQSMTIALHMFEIYRTTNNNTPIHQTSRFTEESSSVKWKTHC